MAAFAGWRMPISFEAGTVAEHRAVREDVGVFDVSHLGTVFLDGAAAEEVVSRTFTSGFADLAPGQSRYTLCCDESGGIVDDLICYRLAPDRFLVVPNASNTDAVVGRLESHAGDRSVSVEDVSGAWAILAVQGPRSFEVVRDATGLDPEPIDYLGVEPCDLAGQDAYACRTGYTGEVGCELVVPNPGAPQVWAALLDADATPCGLGARDTLRLEMGYPLHGNDLSTETTPWEARLGWTVDLDRADFDGRDALRRAKDAPDAPGRRLWGLRSAERRPPRAGMAVLAGGERVGTVTSGSFSPTLEVGIGLAFLARPLGPDDDVEVDVRGTRMPFRVVRPPFVDRDPRG